jgi:hypothetical protein
MWDAFPKHLSPALTANGSDTYVGKKLTPHEKP